MKINTTAYYHINQNSCDIPSKSSSIILNHKIKLLNVIYILSFIVFSCSFLVKKSVCSQIRLSNKKFQLKKINQIPFSQNRLGINLENSNYNQLSYEAEFKGNCDKICLNRINLAKINCLKGVYSKGSDVLELECVCNEDAKKKSNFIQKDYCYTPKTCYLKSLYQACKSKLRLT